MKIIIVGTGYVGLVTGVCLSDFGHKVVCIDKDLKKIEDLNKGIIPIYEPGLDSLLRKNVDSGRLSFSADIVDAIKDSGVVFIAVGTPSRRGDGGADLSYVHEAVKEIASISQSYILFVTKSTVPVGSNRAIAQLIKEVNPDLEFDIASNPEFLREGSAIDDFMKPDRVLVGLESEHAKKIMLDIYRPLYLRDFPIMFTGLESAETIKYASNAFLATKITFINEIADLCEKSGADVKEVSKGMGLDGRIGNKFLHAGPGYGGSCFPKDTSALVNTGEEFGSEMLITKTVIEVNEKVKQRMIDKILAIAGGSVKNKLITIFGITFKPNTDDMREAPSLVIIPALQKQGAKIRVVDPQGYNEGKDLLSGVEWHVDAYESAENAELIVILTEWNEFRALDLSKLAKSMKKPCMADLRNIYNEQEVLSHGFVSYDSVGRGKIVRS
jgi:UDPglucose 6-dehydrogenase